MILEWIKASALTIPFKVAFKHASAERATTQALWVEARAQDDATGFSTPSSVVPQDIINQVLDIRTKIRQGTITPPETVPPGV